MISEVAPILVLLLGIAGLLVGSFVNVLIHRIPSGASVVRPRSRCPQCGTPIAARDNIPLLSWVLLRGRCRSCRASISIRYPLVEGATGLVWALLAWWALGPGESPGLLPLLLALGTAAVALWVIDIDHHRLPDAIVLPLYPITVVGLALAGLVDGAWLVGPAAVGCAVWVVVIGIPWLISGGRGMGFGDVKIAPVLGATLGWVAVGAAVVGVLSAFVMGALVGLLLMALRRAGRRSQLPFGPFLLAGALVGLLVGAALAQLYTAGL